MKPAPFDYFLATSTDEAIQFLSGEEGEAIILAGGQTLMPLLSMRLARPDRVIDINEISDLSGIEEIGNEVIIKACTRQFMALESSLVAMRLPLLRKGLSFVGHLQTRNRGTVGGSIAHADPAAEIPLVALAMDAELELQSVHGIRRLRMEEFVVGPLMTVREPDELLVSVRFPFSPQRVSVGTSFQEVSERHGDFAVVAVAAQLIFDNEVCSSAAIAFGGVDDKPIRIPELEAILTGQAITEEIFINVREVIFDTVSPGSDQHATAAYRRRVAGELAIRAIVEAACEARGGRL